MHRSAVGCVRPLWNWSPETSTSALSFSTKACKSCEEIPHCADSMPCCAGVCRVLSCSWASCCPSTTWPSGWAAASLSGGPWASGKAQDNLGSTPLRGEPRERRVQGRHLGFCHPEMRLASRRERRGRAEREACGQFRREFWGGSSSMRVVCMGASF